MQGYQYFFDQKLVIVWSAPNYMYRLGNVASVLKLDTNLNREFIIFKEVPSDQNGPPLDQLPAYFA